MIKYVAEATRHGADVLVHLSDIDGDTRKLSGSESGFNWGYEGSGPLNLANAILADFIEEEFGHDFMKEVISKGSQQERVFIVTGQVILDWLKQKIASRSDS